MTTLAYRQAHNNTLTDVRVLAIHEYRWLPTMALVTTVTPHGGEPWRHYVGLDRLILQEDS